MSHPLLDLARIAQEPSTLSTMIDKELIVKVAEVIEYMSEPHNAFGIWIAATGVIAGAYFIAPFVPK